MFRKLWNKFFPPLSQLEQKLIEVLVDGFDGETKRLLEAQIRDVNLVQRHRDSKEVILFRMRGFGVHRNSEISFPTGVDAVRFAKITFSSSNGDQFKVTFWITRGFFSIMEFNKSPAKIANETNLTGITRKIICDPLNIPVNRPAEQLLSITNLNESVKIMLQECKASKIFPPLSEAERKNWLEESEIVLPKNLENLFAQIGGFETVECEFLGITELREIEAGGKDFVIVAEHTRRGVMAFEKKNPESGYFLISYEGGYPVLVGNDYASSVKNFCLDSNQ